MAGVSILASVESAYPFSVDPIQVDGAWKAATLNPDLAALLENKIQMAVEHGIVIHTRVGGKEIHPGKQFDKGASESWVPAITSILQQVIVQGFSVVLIQRHAKVAKLTPSAISRATDDITIPTYNLYTLRWLENEGGRKYVVVPSRAGMDMVGVNKGMRRGGKPLKLRKNGTLKGSYIYVSRMNTPMADGSITSAVARLLPRIIAHTQIESWFHQGYYDSTHPPIGMQSAPQVAAVVDKPFIYASIKDLLDPGTTMQTNSRSTIADAQYSSTLSRLMREDPMYASASFNSAPNTLIPGRLTVEYPPGKLPAVVPPVQVDIGQLIALRAQYKQDLCIALGMPIEFLIGDNSTVVAGAEGSRARANSALVGLQAPLIPFLEQIIGAYYRDVLLDAMQMTPEEETRETRKDDEIRRKNEVGVVHEDGDSESSDEDEFTDNGIPTGAPRIKRSKKDKSSAAEPELDNEQLLANGQNGQDGRQVQSDTTTAERTKVPSLKYGKATLRESTRWQRNTIAEDSLTVMFTNTPSAPPEILKEMYREFIITTEDYKHAMLRSQGMPESMMVPEGEPGPEEVRQREIDLQVAETRAVTQGAEAQTMGAEAAVMGAEAKTTAAAAQKRAKTSSSGKAAKRKK